MGPGALASATPRRRCRRLVDQPLGTAAAAADASERVVRRRRRRRRGGVATVDVLDVSGLRQRGVDGALDGTDLWFNGA